MRLFGQNHYGIVMISVILGTLSLPLIYLLGRELGGRFVGLVSIALLAISYTHIQFSRILFGSSASFVSLVVAYVIFKGLRSQQPYLFAVAGVLTGWGVLLYDSSRVIPVILLSILVWLWLWQRQTFKIMVRNLWILISGVFLAFGPVLVYMVRNLTSFSGRANSVLLWVPEVWKHEWVSYKASNPIQVIWQQIWRTFLTLHLTGDGSPHFSFQRPMVDPLTAALFILGLGYFLSRLKNIKFFTILSWIFLTFILGGVLTADPPYWPHLNIALPAIVLVAAVGAKSLGDQVNYYRLKAGSFGERLKAA
jgi:4-amino-4-deoxy-L-arabinose transferase-like glycosyltransferase